MSKYVISATGNDSYEPYQPVTNVHPLTGERLTDPGKIKEALGPHFSCDGAIHDPHFHSVEKHPIIDSEINGKKVNFEQLHVPGYDQKLGVDTDPESNPYNSITGWSVHVPMDDEKNNINYYQFANSRKFPKTMDNDEAMSNWKSHMTKLFGNGSIETKPMRVGDHTGIPTSSYVFHPKESPSNPANSKCVFIPRVEHAGIVFPAISDISFGDDASSPEDAKNKLTHYANITKEHDQQDMENKITESPSYWEDAFKRSKKIYTLGSQGKILDMQNYNPHVIKHGSACDCDNCNSWSYKDFR